MKELDANPKVMPIRAKKPLDLGAIFALSLAVALLVAIPVYNVVSSERGSKSYDDVPAAFGWGSFLITLISSYVWMALLSTRQVGLNELWAESQKALKISSDYLHGRGVIKSLHIADENYHKALGGFMKVAKESTCGETCFTCAVAMGELAEPGGFVVDPETKFMDRSLVAATFLRAALLGSRPSQLKVAQLYQEGVGFVRDLTEAYAWFNICAAHGNVEAERSRESLATIMSQAEITKAQQRSQELFAMVNWRN